MVTISVMWDAGADTSFGLPSYASAGAAGADLRANFTDRSGIVIAPGARALVPTGLRAALPSGYEMQIRPRSGLALKHGVTLLNTPGTVDSDYRGPIGVIVVNLGHEAFEVRHGMRIAQAVVAAVSQAVFVSAQELDETGRGTGGFGSTGVG
ncbi:dUTP diphosphatase [Roseovarius sp. LXJ103]|uniref:dUTP diphosphatase n=1 Tax=Roseovarius carneus TaxID=2853164 RepID=UPI000D61C814|nr:dUTP diphosphatase [Roseovarius carneus]MBZ8118233.1 dUTP diphosphatase [Roseovarius carneus]PWE36044.1 dUTP diphosphatase [Pelagicola sp. LXJ1103]